MGLQFSMPLDFSNVPLNEGHEGHESWNLEGRQKKRFEVKL
jgi:hypothetical protein